MCNFLCIFKMNINISYGLKNLYILCDITCEMKISPAISTNKKRHSHQQFLVSKCEYYAKSLHSCPTLCDPIEGSSPGFPFPGILQAKTLEWVVISFSNAWKWKVKVKSLSSVWLLATPWTAAYQAPPSMGFSRQEYWSGVPLPSPKPIFSWI